MKEEEEDGPGLGIPFVILWCLGGRGERRAGGGVWRNVEETEAPPFLLRPYVWHPTGVAWGRGGGVFLQRESNGERRGACSGATIASSAKEGQAGDSAGHIFIT